jgi:putative ATP-dependent endonuclease of OLD family
MRASRYSLLGRILQHVEREFQKEPARVEEFEVKIRQAAEVLRIDLFKKFEETLSSYVLKQIGLTGIQMSFQPFDPMNHYKALDLRISEHEKGPVLSWASMGTGVQSAIVLSLLQAYRELVHESAILAIEEPEAFLHPHACRYFYRVLSQLSEKIQVFYTTHSAAFLDVKRFEDIIYVRKNETGETTAISGKGLTGSKADSLKTERKLDTSRQEMFFAKKVVLVEGPDDKQVLARAFELKGVDVDREGISIVDCGGKPNIPAFAKIISHYKLPSMVVCDKDMGKTTGDGLTKEIETCLAGIGMVFVLDPDLEGVFNLSNKQSIIDWQNLLDTLKDFASLPQTVQEAVRSLA